MDLHLCFRYYFINMELFSILSAYLKLKSTTWNFWGKKFTAKASIHNAISLREILIMEHGTKLRNEINPDCIVISDRRRWGAVYAYATVCSSWKRLL